jgi:2-oxoglutarate ferredoxin oxidoreductase subunit alpha
MAGLTFVLLLNVAAPLHLYVPDVIFRYISSLTSEATVLQDVVIKFAGDSGDGMQLTGSQFTKNTALLGIDLTTFPDFPYEIRAPQGTLPGVSGFQLRFSSNPVFSHFAWCVITCRIKLFSLMSGFTKGGLEA